MKNLYFIFLTALWYFFLSLAPLRAQVAVSPQPVVVAQPNNYRLTIIGAGTAQYPYTETTDGYTVLRNKKGYYMYAKPGKNGKLVPSCMKAHNPADRKKREQKRLTKKLKPHVRDK